jgi:hypothetical protein
VNRWRSSPRFRRRSWWSLALLAAAGSVIAVALGMENTSQFPAQRLQERPAQVVAAPRPRALGKADAAAVWATTTRFLRTAVARKDLRHAYDLVGPELRGGMTRAAWARGANPVVPFAVAKIHEWTLAYAYRNDVALDVGLVAKPSSDTVAKSFRIELRRARADAPWKVVAWLPIGLSGPGNVKSARAGLEAAPPPLLAPRTTSLAAWWLAFPVALLSLAIVLPAAVWLRTWRVGRKAERAYRRAVGLPDL